MLVRPGAVDEAVALPTEAFWSSGMASVFSACLRLRASGEHINTATITDALRREGTLDLAGGPGIFTDLIAECPGASSAAVASYIAIISRLHRQRRVKAAALDVAAAIDANTDPAPAIERLAGESTATPLTDAWAPDDLSAILSGSDTGPTPTVLERQDGLAVFYAGRVNAVLGESEVGKGWFALLGCTQEIRHRRHVVYVDFEDEAAGVVARLRLMGLGPAEIAEFFHYVRADDPVDGTAKVALVALTELYGASLVVIDGITEAMVSGGWSMLDNDDVARFYLTLPRPLARTGAAVVMIDHLPKNAEGKGAIGAQHKRSGIDGCALRLDVTSPFGVGREGGSRVAVDKDRSGKVRGFALMGKTVGQMVVRPVGEGLEVFMVPIKPGPVDSAEGVPVIGVPEGVMRVLKGRAGAWHSGAQVVKAIREAHDKGRYKVRGGKQEAIRAALADFAADPDSGVQTKPGRRAGELNYAWFGSAPESEAMELSVVADEPAPVEVWEEPATWGTDDNPWDDASGFVP